MDIELSEEPITEVARLARVPIAFKVERILELTIREGGLGGFVLSERRLDVPYVKNYDALPGEGPAQWSLRFDLSNWGLVVARAGGRLVGGAVIAFDTPALDMLEGRQDLAILWDIRVAPKARFTAAELWATKKGCRQLKVETQNINVAACRFYNRQGCELGTIHRFAYPELSDEIQMLWYKDLSQGESTG
jgi:ribosomal protein S18 acetylase RimI-like enzyme